MLKRALKCSKCYIVEVHVDIYRQLKRSIINKMVMDKYFVTRP